MVLKGKASNEEDAAATQNQRAESSPCMSARELEHVDQALKVSTRMYRLTLK